jgi:hypothetical protein
MRVTVGEVFQLDEFVEAGSGMQTRRAGRKIIVSPAP